MKKISITPFDYQYTAEIGQAVPYKYAFLSSDLKQCHTLIKCRDFLQDAVRNYLFNRKDSIYSFCYNPKTMPPIDVHTMRMLVVQDPVVDNTQFLIEMQIAHKILNLFEKDAGMEKSQVFEVDKYGKPAVAFFGDKDWVNSPFLISLYTFLIRLGARGYKFKNLQELKECIANDKPLPKSADNDHEYLQVTGKYLHKILPVRDKMMFQKGAAKGRFDQGDIEEFHYHTGVVSLCQKSLYDNNLKQVVQEHILS